MGKGKEGRDEDRDDRVGEVKGYGVKVRGEK